jgi:hypothetical protein
MTSLVCFFLDWYGHGCAGADGTVAVWDIPAGKAVSIFKGRTSMLMHAYIQIDHYTWNAMQ